MNHYQNLTDNQLFQRQQQLRAEIAAEETQTVDLANQKTQKMEKINSLKNETFENINAKFEEAGVGYKVDFSNWSGFGDYPQLLTVAGNDLWKIGQGRIVSRQDAENRIENGQRSVRKLRAKNADLLTKNDVLERALLEKRAKTAAIEDKWERELAEITALPADKTSAHLKMRARKVVEKATKRKRKFEEANL